MNNKNIIFLILLSGAGIYFFKNGETSNLITVVLFAVFAFMFFENKEHLAGDPGSNPLLNKTDTEQIKILASMINEGKLVATSLTLTGDLTVGGKSNITGNLAVGGKSNITGDLDIGGVVNIAGPQRDINTYNGLQKGMTIDSTTIAAPGVMHLYGNGTLHLLNRDGVVVNHAWASEPRFSSGNLSVTKNVIIPKHKSLLLGDAGLSYGRNDNLDRLLTYKANGRDNGRSLWVKNIGRAEHDDWGFFGNDVWNDVYTMAGISKHF